MTFDCSLHKLGRKAPRFGAKKLRLKKYLPANILSLVPSLIDWHAQAVILNGSWGMLANGPDPSVNPTFGGAGDCTEATKYHAMMMARAAQGLKFAPTGPMALADYIRVTGKEGAAYDPTTGANDNGCVFADVLADWKAMAPAGCQVLATFGVDPHDYDEVRAAQYLFGFVCLGMGMPNAWQTTPTWSIPTNGDYSGDYAPYGWGGHEIPSGKSTPSMMTVVSWGEEVELDPRALPVYCDEIDVVLTSDWVPPAGVAPNHFNLAQLQADEAALQQAA